MKITATLLASILTEYPGLKQAEIRRDLQPLIGQLIDHRLVERIDGRLYPREKPVAPSFWARLRNVFAP